MIQLPRIVLLTALAAGPMALWAQEDAPIGKEVPAPFGKSEKDRRFGPTSGDFGRGRSGWDGSRSSKNPMDDFRRLLALSPAEREQDLANRSEGFRTMLLKKLQEYDLLTPEQQELRIRSTELRFDMMYLLRASPERRAEKLERMPEDRRKLAEARLKQWDQLSPALRQEVLEHQSTLTYVIRVEAAPASAKEDVFAGMSPEYREKVKERIAKVNELPREQRNRMLENFHKLFDLSDKEQEGILEKLNETERAKVEQKLAEFERLSPDERKRCIDSARKFNNLNASEQARFLATAERWEKMSEEERNAWRDLLKKMPPLPPGLVPTPPLPPGSRDFKPAPGFPPPPPQR